MRHILVTDEIGNPYFFDHPDGRMLCLPLATTQDVLEENFGQHIHEIKCGHSQFVFRQFEKIRVLIASNELDVTIERLDAEINLIYDLMLLLFGATALHGPGLGRLPGRKLGAAHVMKRHKELLSLFDTTRSLMETHESVLAQGIEVLDVNNEIRTSCHTHLQSLVSNYLPETAYALIFVGPKLFIQISSGKDQRLTPNSSDIVRSHSVDVLASNSPSSYSSSFSKSAFLSHHEVFLLTLVCNALFFPQTRSSFEQRILPVADYSDHTILARGFDSHNLNLNNLDNSSTSFGESPSDSSPVSPTAVHIRHRNRTFSDPTVLSEDLTDVDGEDGFVSAQEDLWESLDGESFSEATPRSRDFDSNVIENFRASSDFDSISGLEKENCLENSNEEKKQRVDLNISMDESFMAAINENDNIDSRLPESYLKIIHLRTHRYKKFMAYCTEVLPQISMVIISKHSSFSERDSRELETVRNQFGEWLAKNYADYLLTKGHMHLPALTYFHSIPGLVHFIFVDRVSSCVISPTLTAPHGSLCTDYLSSFDNSENMLTNLRREVWKMYFLGKQFLGEGNTSAMVRSINFHYSYRFWFEVDGEEITLDHGLPKDKVTTSYVNPLYFNDIIKSAFPGNLDIKCFELFSLYIGLLPASAVAENDAQLLNLLRFSDS